VNKVSLSVNMVLSITFARHPRGARWYVVTPGTTQRHRSIGGWTPGRPHRLVADDAPSVTPGTSPCKTCRSVPLIVVLSARTIASASAASIWPGISGRALAPETVADERLHMYLVLAVSPLLLRLAQASR
jgi:hypothetical protein